ncbi:MAG TPA: DUF2505 family protein [Polyangiaceae bacterium]|nr:DUF2505 family protein [Polyangiaceae bacterium]
MPDFRVEHTFNCSEDTFWSKVFLDEEYNRKLFLERLKFSAWREASREERDQKLHRVVEAAPPMGEVPAALKAVIGDNAGYQERGVLDRAAHRYTVEVVPNRLADKIQVKLEMITVADPSSPERCKRTVKGSVTAKIFGVGGLLEKKIIADLEKSYSKSAEFTNQFIAEKGLR